MKHNFSDKVIIVTGGTGALGGILIKSFLNCHPKTIVITYRSEKEMQELKADLSNSFEQVIKDFDIIRIYKNRCNKRR